MQRQGSFSQAEYASKKKQTRRDKFLAEMERVVRPAFAGACVDGPRFARRNCGGCREVACSHVSGLCDAVA